MRAPLVVVDASAVAAVLFREPSGGPVAATLSERRLVGPTLLRYELASVARKKRDDYPALGAEVFALLEAWRRMRIEEVQVEPRAIAALAERLGVTAYDAAYLWLAEYLQAPLVTLDTTMQAAASELDLPST